MQFYSISDTSTSYSWIRSLISWVFIRASAAFNMRRWPSSNWVLFRFRLIGFILIFSFLVTHNQGLYRKISFYANILIKPTVSGLVWCEQIDRHLNVLGYGWNGCPWRLIIQPVFTHSLIFTIIFVKTLDFHIWRKLIPWEIFNMELAKLRGDYCAFFRKSFFWNNIWMLFFYIKTISNETNKQCDHYRNAQ